MRYLLWFVLSLLTLAPDKKAFAQTAPLVENLGPLLYSATQEKQWLYRHPLTGDAHLLMFWDLINAPNAWLYSMQTFDLNLSTGTSVLVDGPKGRPGPNAGAVHPNGKVYYASSDPGTFMELDPQTGASRAVRALADKGAQYMEVGDDGKVYIGETIKGYVESYDPATDTWTSYGIMDDPGPPYYRYAYTLGADNRYLYVGIGQSPWYLVVYDRQTGTQQTFWKGQNLAGCQVYKGTAGGWYVQASPLGWFQLVNGAPVPVSGASVQPWYRHGNMDFDLPSVQAAYGYDFNLDDVTPYGATTGTALATVQWKRTGTSTWAQARPAINVLPSTVKQLYTHDCETLFGLGDTYGPLFSWDNATKATTILGVPHTSNYDAAWANGRWYVTGYAAATLTYDPTAPWSPSNPLKLAGISKYHYYATVPATNAVHVAVHHERDSTGGSLGWYDPATDTLSTLRAPFVNVDPTHLITALSGTKLVYAGASLLAGDSGKLFVIDAVTHTIEQTITPLPGGFSPGKLVEVKPGIVVGIAGAKAYRVNLGTGAIEWTVTLPSAAFPNTKTSDQRPRLGPDGAVWYPTASAVTRLDPATGGATNVQVVSAPINILFLHHPGTVQFDLLIYGDATLRRVSNFFPR